MVAVANLMTVTVCTTDYKVFIKQEKDSYKLVQS